MINLIRQCDQSQRRFAVFLLVVMVLEVLFIRLIIEHEHRGAYADRVANRTAQRQRTAQGTAGGLHGSDDTWTGQRKGEGILLGKEVDSYFAEHFGFETVCVNANPVSSTPEPADDSDIDDSENNYDHVIINYIDGQETVAENSDDEGPYFNVTDLPNSKLREPCGCSKDCFKKFSPAVSIDHIWMMREIGKNEKEMQIMTILKTVGVDCSRTRRGEDRKRTVYEYVFQGEKVCRNAFMVFYDIHDFTLRALISHIHEHGISERVHANRGKKGKNALVFDDVKRVVQFLEAYASEHGMPQPAAPRGRPDIPPIFLHSSSTKRSLHKTYIDGLADQDIRVVKITAFNGIWKSCVPHIQIASPRMDVCSTCELSRKNIIHAVTDIEKLSATDRMRDHLILAQRERDVYLEELRKCKQDYHNRDEGVQLQNIHYTFDFAQNVNLPHHARQMGPLYFLTLKKVHVFGFRVDGVPRQLNYLFDECQSIGMDGKLAHGPNAVIFMVHHGLTTAGLGEERCSMHADNCADQNKNRFFIAYLCWRVMVGLQKDITLHFQIPGHTRCLIDAGFANFKRVYRRSDADSLQDLCQQVNTSSSVNEAVMYPQWRWQDWKAFFGLHFKALKGISRYQHFRVSHEQPGVVYMRKQPDGDEVAVQMLRDKDYCFDSSARPPVLNAPGLSRDRQAYLYKHVRKFVRGSVQEMTCPCPEHEE